jgi:hypothetical protein
MEEFEDVVDEDVDVVEIPVDVIDEKTIAVEDKFVVGFEETGFGGIDVEALVLAKTSLE